MVLEQERLHDETYRWEVVSQLMQERGDAVAQFCWSWWSAGLAEEITQEVLVAALADCLSRLRDEERIVSTLRYWKEMP